MRPMSIKVQEKRGKLRSSYAFELTYTEFLAGVRERTEPGTTMLGGV